MPHGQQTELAYLDFVHELAKDPDRQALLARLRAGHQPDCDGWCSHPAHAHRWERHPCSIMQFVNLVEDDSTVTHTNTPDATDSQDLPAGWQRVRRAPSTDW